MKLVLQTYNLNYGGPQRWVVFIADFLKRRGWDVHVLTIRDRGSMAADTGIVRELESKNIPIYPVEGQRNYFRTIQEIRRVIRQIGDVVAIHCNSDFSDFHALAAAYLEGVPVRISHSRNTHQIEHLRGVHLRKRRFHQFLITRFANRYLGVSLPAAKSLFGKYVSEESISVVPSGLDLSQIEFLERKKASGIGRRFIHVGRFAPQKNHPFLLETFRALLRREPDARLTFLGAGPDSEKLSALIAQDEALTRAVSFRGTSDDVIGFMRDSQDVLFFPSLWEGTPRAVIEAQVAGIQVVCSEAVPEISCVVPELVQRLSLERPPSEWVNALLRQSAPISPEIIRKYFVDSLFNMEHQVNFLESMYKADEFSN